MESMSAIENFRLCGRDKMTDSNEKSYNNTNAYCTNTTDNCEEIETGTMIEHKDFISNETGTLIEYCDEEKNKFH